MTKGRISILLDARLVAQIDHLINLRLFTSRSQAVESAVRDWLAEWKARHFAKQCAELNPREEQAFADAVVGGSLTGWPEY